MTLLYVNVDMRTTPMYEVKLRKEMMHKHTSKLELYHNQSHQMLRLVGCRDHDVITEG